MFVRLLAIIEPIRFSPEIKKGFEWAYPGMKNLSVEECSMKKQRLHSESNYGASNRLSFKSEQPSIINFL